MDYFEPPDFTGFLQMQAKKGFAQPVPLWGQTLRKRMGSCIMKVVNGIAPRGMPQGEIAKGKEALPLIQVIAGNKGSGKTKRIIDMANQASQESKHDIVFIDDDNRYMFDLRHQVRFVNAGEYSLTSDQMFMGFLAGAVAQNFDVGLILIDAFKKLIKCELDTTQWLFDRLEALSEKHSVDFVISISEDPANLPAFIQKYVI